MYEVELVAEDGTSYETRWRFNTLADAYAMWEITRVQNPGHEVNIHSLDENGPLGHHTVISSKEL